jgi:hypothetical protein
MAKSFSVKLLENNKEINRKINAALSKEVNRRVSKKIPNLERQIVSAVTTALNSSPEIISLRTGLLKLEFGLDSDPTFEIVQAIVSSLRVVYEPINPRDFSGGVVIQLQPTDFANLLSLPAAYQEIEDGSLPWLSWLLTLGDSVIITRFGVEFGQFPSTRTGGARMTEKAAPFKVNSAYSGTVDDNFITRSIARISGQIQRIIEGVL